MLLEPGEIESLFRVFERFEAVFSELDERRRRYGDEPGLLLALGRVCAAEKLWGKAEDYLKLALRGRATVGGHAALAELYESLGRGDEAAEQFRAAARLAVGG